MENEEIKEELTNNEQTEKKPLITWKVFFVVVTTICISYLMYFSIKIYKSDWYVTQTMSFKSVEETPLGKNLSYEYTTAYAHKRLKVNLTLDNVDDKIMALIPELLSPQDSLVTIELLNNDGVAISKLKFPVSEFKPVKDKPGAYIIKKSFKFSRDRINKIKGSKVTYQKILDMKYENIVKLVKEINQKKIK